MAEMCSICGLPKDICVCGQIDTEQRKLFVMERRVKGSKFITVISGIDDSKDAESLFKEMKKELACGGTVKGTKIELQGKHKKKAEKFLMTKGYSANQFS